MTDRTSDQIPTGPARAVADHWHAAALERSDGGIYAEWTTVAHVVATILAAMDVEPDELAAATARAVKAEADLAEMTRCRDNAISYAHREHVPIDLGDSIDTDGTRLAERLCDELGGAYSWDEGGDLEGTVAFVVGVVRPYLARFVDQARVTVTERDQARAQLAELGRPTTEWGVQRPGEDDAEEHCGFTLTRLHAIAEEECGYVVERTAYRGRWHPVDPESAAVPRSA